MRILKHLLIAVSFLASVTWSTGTLACPFCSVVSQTLSQEIAGSDISVIARLVKLPVVPDLDDPAGLDLDALNNETGLAEFKVVDIIHGKNGPALGSIIKVIYFGSNDKLQKPFLINGLIAEKVDWSTPQALPVGGIKYIKTLSTLPEKGADRLEFFLGHLEDSAPLLAQDAYDEFARAPYDVIIALAPRMDRSQLLGWIEDAKVGPTRRRLYLTMLGVCGREEDAEILKALLLYDYQQIKPGLSALLQITGELGPIYGVTILNEMIRADVRRKQQCLDALIAAYLKLKGEEGLALIEKRFLTNPNVEYQHLHAAIMALRFHGDDAEVIPKARLLKSLRLLLDHTEIADQVITDLTRWEDWSVMERLITLFKDSKEGAWVRQPVISYLITAAKQPAEIGKRANQALGELEKIDPKNVKRMRKYVAFSMLAKPKPKREPSIASDEQNASLDASLDTSLDNALNESTVKNDSNTKTAQTTPEPTPETATPLVSATAGPSRMLIIGGPLIAGLVLFGIYALLLRGADVRSPNHDS